MYFIYILESLKTGKYYTGYTADIDKRLKQHNSGANRSTKNGAPWRVIHYEIFENRAEAWKREQQVKSYKGGRAFKALVESNQ